MAIRAPSIVEAFFIGSLSSFISPPSKQHFSLLYVKLSEGVVWLHTKEEKEEDILSSFATKKKSVDSYSWRHVPSVLLKTSISLEIDLQVSIYLSLCTYLCLTYLSIFNLSTFDLSIYLLCCLAHLNLSICLCIDFDSSSGVYTPRHDDSDGHVLITTTTSCILFFSSPFLSFVSLFLSPFLSVHSLSHYVEGQAKQNW